LQVGASNHNSLQKFFLQLILAR